MKDFIAKLSASFSRLSSSERSLIIIGIISVFAIVNYFFVLPHVNDWGKLTNRMNEAQLKQKKYEEMIAQSTTFQKKISELEGENSAVPQEDQSVNFLQAINSQAAQSGVAVIANNRQPERTNQFFLERAQALTVQSGEQQLVNFLYNLGTGTSLIRVRALSIRPDAQRYALSATVTLIASFQKKPAKPALNSPPKKPAAAPAVAPKETPKPVLPAVKPGVPAAPTGPKPSTPKK